MERNSFFHFPAGEYLSAQEGFDCEYPEVSFGVILGFSGGLMGIEPDARFNRVTTIYRTSSIDSSYMQNVPLLGTAISIKHFSDRSEFNNEGNTSVIWRAKFYGSPATITVNKKNEKAIIEKDVDGKMISYVDIKISKGETAIASIK